LNFGAERAARRIDAKLLQGDAGQIKALHSVRRSPRAKS
jgi:hypothetical protein